MSKNVNISTRRMITADIAGVLQIQESCYPKALHESYDTFKNILNAQESICIIACNRDITSGYIVGYATSGSRKDFSQGYVSTSHPNDCVYLHDLCIARDNRGLNIGQLLFNTFESEVVKMGYNRIIGLSITSALGFWMKLGFEQGPSSTYNGENVHKIYEYFAL